MNTLTLFLSRSALRIRKNKRIRFDYLVMVLGIIVSVLVVTTALNLFEGYQRTLKKIMLDTSAHLMIYPILTPDMSSSEAKSYLKQLADRPEIKSLHAVYANAAIAKNGDKIRSGYVRAYDPGDKTDFWFHHYAPTGLANLTPGNVIIGDKLARDLGLQIGSKLTLMYTKADAISPLGIIPYSMNFTIGSVIKTGYYELDKMMIIMSVADAYKLYQITPQFTYLEVNLKDKFINQTAQLTSRFQVLLGPLCQIRNWIDFNGNLFSLIQMEKWLIFLVFSFLILIAALNCVSTVSTAIIDRKKEIAILKAIGVKLKQIKEVVFLRIFAICLGSILGGLLLGTFTAWLITRQNLYHLKGDVYFIDTITTQITPLNYLVITFFAVTIVSLCIILPLRYLNKFEIIDILRGNG